METRQERSGIDLSVTGILEETARAAVQWTWNTFGSRSCLLTSMQDAALIDIAMSVSPMLPVVFLDNGHHFEATLQTLKEVERRYGIGVEVIRPTGEVQRDVVAGECCDAKVDLLEEALSGRDAWMSGLQRSQTQNRRDTPIVGRDRRGKVKVSPFAQWSESDRLDYIGHRDVITNPLLDEGYTSVGCAPCTTKPDGEQRSGRWADSDRTECGLHL